VKTCVLLDHDGVLVDTERWCFRAGERALAEVGVVPDEAQHLSEGRDATGPARNLSSGCCVLWV
jgi:beta-phosphoglucomutase-like phosphatase (HAD superfamily)